MVERVIFNSVDVRVDMRRRIDNIKIYYLLFALTKYGYRKGFCLCQNRVFRGGTDRGLPILLLPVVLSNNYAAVVVVGNPSSSN